LFVMSFLAHREVSRVAEFCSWVPHHFRAMAIVVRTILVRNEIQGVTYEVCNSVK
jgi:hypothetical protein